MNSIKNIAKQVVHAAEEVVEEVVEVAQHLAHGVVHEVEKLTHTTGERIEDFCHEKKIEVTRETIKTAPHDNFNVIASADGSIETNNLHNTTRALLHDVLFQKNGEERVTLAMAEKLSSKLSKVS